MAGGILAVFCVFLLFLLIPAHLLILPVILGAGVLMFVTVFLIRAPGPITPEGPDPEPSPEGPGSADEPSVMPENPAGRCSPFGYRLAVLISGWFVLSFFWYEIWPRVNNNNLVPLPLIAFQLILIFTFCSMFWHYRNLSPAMEGLRQATGRTGTALKATFTVLRKHCGRPPPHRGPCSPSHRCF